MGNLLYPLYCDMCGKVGMYTVRLLQSGVDDISPDLFILLDGTRPFNGQEIECGNCHVKGGEGFPFHYESDQPVEVSLPA